MLLPNMQNRGVQVYLVRVFLIPILPGPESYIFFNPDPECYYFVQSRSRPDPRSAYPDPDPGSLIIPFSEPVFPIPFQNTGFRPKKLTLKRQP